VRPPASLRLKKGFTTEKIRAIHQASEKAGVPDCHSFILGTQSETLENVHRTLDFILDLDPYGAVLLLWTDDLEALDPALQAERAALREKTLALLEQKKGLLPPLDHSPLWGEFLRRPLQLATAQGTARPALAAHQDVAQRPGPREALRRRCLSRRRFQAHAERIGLPVITLHGLRDTCATSCAPVVPAFAYRFDGRDRSIVISGDTRPSETLVKLARGADVLVHSVMFPSAVERLVARVPNASGLRASILAHQTSVEDAGRIARAAGVKMLVLSHLVNPDDPTVTDRMWLDAARTHFGGEVIVGRDLLEV